MTARDAAPVAEGEILAGKYKVEKVLGVGGMGVVVAATHLTLRQKVAIKFLLHGASEEVTTRFLREARAAVRLRSDHVAKVIDVGELEDGAPFMVMEYLDGTDLAATIRAAAKLPVATAVDYVLQACEAIAEAHVAGIIHRDLKPANLFLTKGADGSPLVKVLDFGISKDAGGEAAEQEQGLTKTTAVLGSPSFMAPEQMRSTKSADARADIWSLGVILYQLLTKTLPYKAPSFLELVMLVLHEDAPPPTSRRIDIPPLLEAAIMRCLERDRDRRFPSVAELAITIAPFGGPDARRSAERVARTQGVVMQGPGGGADVEDAAGPRSGDANASVGPASGRSGSHLSRSAQPPAVSTLESANADAPAPPSRSQQPPTAIEAQPISARAQGKTGDTWATADSAAQKVATTERRTASRMWIVGAIGLVCGGIVAWFVVVGMPRRGADATTAGTAPPSSSVFEATPPSAAPSATTTASATPTERGAASSATTAESDEATPVPRHVGGVAPRARPSAAPRAESTAVVAAPVTPPPAAPPAASSTTKPKKNPLDLDIK